ncbi:MAG: hypothetical protein N4A46_02935 [Schleiferiaceae bacterium]|nr:hypothetical protein [Schleiferiaceae bacterium]
MKIFRTKKRPLVVRILSLLFGLVVMVIVGAFLYVDHQKNELTKELLGEVNAILVGDIEVDKVKISSLWTYPEIDLTLLNTQVFEPFDSLGYRKTPPVVSVPKIVVHANLEDLFSNKVHLEWVELYQPKVLIDRDENADITIGNVFSLAEEEPDTASTDSISFVLKIDSVYMQGLEVKLTDRSLEDSIPVYFEAFHGSVTYAKSKVYGYGKGRGKAMLSHIGDSIQYSDLPLNLFTRYEVGLKERFVTIDSNVIDLDDALFNFYMGYDYNKPSHMKVTLKTPQKGVALETLLAENDTLENIEDEPIHLAGNVHFATHIDYRSGKTPLLNRLKADLSLHGDQLTLRGVDLDKIIEKYKRSQNFNLIDVGAVMFAGPVGLALTKGGDYTMLVMTGLGDSSHINQFVSEWSLEQGTLQINDLALSTPKNRLAANGHYYVGGDSLDFDIYLVDRYGCSMAHQGLKGKADNPEMGRLKVIKTLFGPVTNLFRDVGFRNCEVVYAGKVAHPLSEQQQKRKDKREKRRKKKEKK